MRIPARGLLVAVLLLLTGCNAEPGPGGTEPPTGTPPEDGTAQTCIYNEVEYPEGYVFGSDGGVVRCTGGANGLCNSGPLAGRSCIVATECHATCTRGQWR